MEINELRKIAYRAGVSDEDVFWVESLGSPAEDMEWPDILLDNLEEEDA